VAIAIARAVGRPVEDVFQLAAPAEGPTAVAATATPAGPIVAGRVGQRIVPWSVDGGLSVMDGFRPSDGVLISKSAASFHAPPSLIDRTAFVVGCDPSLGILADLVTRHSRDCRLIWIPGSSQQALDAVRSGTAHVAGIHLRDKKSSSYNTTHAGRALQSGGVLLAYAAWQQGFMARPGIGRVEGVGALAERKLRLVNREEGSGSRALFDQLLAEGRLSSRKIAGYGDAVPSHMSVARRIAGGSADVGIGLQSVANAFGLEFSPLADVVFDLVLPHEHESHPAIEKLLQVLQGAEIRSALLGLPGYDVQHIGDVRQRYGTAA
jgi:molybdate-binding protein